MSTLHMFRGKLSAVATGYWFTAGGEKGSFGYYPHLKRMEGGKAFPVIPDTQVHGDLRMAALWLSNLDEKNFPKGLVGEIFGRGGDTSPSLLSINDLELSQACKKKWSLDRFVVRPRSEIDDKTRTNQEHMLAFQELAYVDGLTLEADFCIGYFKEEDKAKKALDLIRASLRLLSGFGAFRSRGFGRARVEINDKDITLLKVEYPDAASGKKSAGKKGAGKRGAGKTGVFCYTLTLLSPFRNKPVNPARTQLLQSQKTITDRQLRAWFAKTFHDLFGDWPAPQRMPWIRFSSCRPALKAENKITAAYFPPFSTLQFEDGSIKDCFRVKREENDPADLENFAHVKAKPLKESIFLTNANRPSAFALKTQKRLRNSMTPAFATLEEGGLFVQELVEKDQPFCGAVTLTGDNNDFLRKAHFILEKVYPKINGAFFEPHVEKLTPEINAVGEEDPTVFVLTEPVNYSPGRMAQACQVRLDTLSNYNTMLRRPRRNRIVFAPGSLVSENFEDVGITWQGLSSLDPVDARFISKPVPSTAPHSELPQPEAALKSLTRAQAGNLRRFLEMKPDVAKNQIKALLDKYHRWETKTIAKHLIPKEYLKEAKDLLDRGNIPAFKSYINGILDRFAVAAWEEESKKAAGKVDEGGPHGDAK